MRWFGLAVILVGAVSVGVWVRSDPHDQLLHQVRIALARGQTSRAEQLLKRALQAVPESSEALRLAARFASQQQRYSEAAEYYARLPDDGNSHTLLAFCQAGDLHFFKLNQPSLAERYYRAVLRHDRHDYTAHAGLADLLKLTGRSWESMRHHLEVVRQGRFSLDHLLVLGMTEAVIVDAAHMQQCRTTTPDDPLPRVALARIALYRRELTKAKELLQPVIADHAHLLEAQARWGQILAESKSEAEYLSWHRQLPVSSEQHPEIWFVRGAWAQKHNQPRAAVRCFWEAVRRDPNHQAANYQLSQSLAALGRPAWAEKFRQRSEWLPQITETYRLINLDRENVQLMRRASQLTEQLGRIWESWGWNVLILSLRSDFEAAQRDATRLRAILDRETGIVMPSRNPALQIDLADYPLPVRQESVPTERVQTSRDAPSHITFVESAKMADLNFTYFNGAETELDAKRMFALTGGGVAVIDYDGDAWPDVYLTQGSPLNPGRRTPPVDRLYRNSGLGRFADVTTKSELGDPSFSQGAAVGDLNNDGFADLYVANIGGNRLYVNNGDGTFSDVTEATEVAGNAWTTSCLLADLNGDSFADIYDVNYLTGDDVLERVCPDPHGKPRQCLPVLFPAAQDRVLLNLANGAFEDQTESAGIVVPGGRGLGIVAVDLHRNGRLDVFVANDMSANFFFVNQSQLPGTSVRFVEQAAALGLAFDRDGNAQACMGVAAGDANRDGRLDFFVTNFYHEWNTMYLQKEDWLFSDSTRETGLFEPGFSMLGFGTQFLDADLDGHPDLVVANGHIDDVSNENIPYRMRPQFFRNSGDGPFVEVRAEALGPYFETRHLGRALAKLDWNRDGRPDFVVSHMDTPVALLTNTTQNGGHFVSIRLCGGASGRDAIGATVQISAAGQTWQQQLIAGDGYQASNERRLIFGLGGAGRVDRLAVRWPSGHEQSFLNTGVDQELVIVEGRNKLLTLPGR